MAYNKRFTAVYDAQHEQNLYTRLSAFRINVDEFCVFVLFIFYWECSAPRDSETVRDEITNDRQMIFN